MDASILMDKFLNANAKWQVSTNVVESLANDLELAEGSDEVEALLGLCKFRERKGALCSISWRSFVLIYLDSARLGIRRHLCLESSPRDLSPRESQLSTRSPMNAYLRSGSPAYDTL
jgi:hypothetical protein